MNMRVLVAGLAGGIAEILWVLAYGTFAPVSAVEVAREVTASVLPGLAASGAAPVLGVGIHLALSVVLAAAFVAALAAVFPGRGGVAGYLAIAVATLAGIWALNFLLVLPVLNPRFVTLMPYAATLASKALFGLTMAAVLARGKRLV